MSQKPLGGSGVIYMAAAYVSVVTKGVKGATLIIEITLIIT